MQWVDKSKIVRLEREKNDDYKQRLHNGEGSINKTNKKKKNLEIKDAYTSRWVTRPNLPILIFKEED